MTIETAWAITAGCMIALTGIGGSFLRRLEGKARVLGALAVGAVTVTFWFWVIQDLLFASTDVTLRALGVSLSLNVAFLSFVIASKLPRNPPDSRRRNR